MQRRVAQITVASAYYLFNKMGDSFTYVPIDPLDNSAMDSQNPYTHGDSASQPFYSVREQALGTLKPLRLICIGAGVSGINLLRTLRLNLNDYEAVVYEKNNNVGGTWFENRYPGCKCDIPSHCYQYSWRQNKNWSSFFAPAGEISEYLGCVCEEENLSESIKLSHQVVAASWDELSGLWTLRIRNLKTGEQFDDTANFLINACGILKYVLSLFCPGTATLTCRKATGSGLK